MAEIPVRPPLPPYFDRLSSIGQAEGRLGTGSGKDEVFQLATMRGGRRGGIVVYRIRGVGREHGWGFLGREVDYVKERVCIIAAFLK